MSAFDAALAAAGQAPEVKTGSAFDLALQAAQSQPQPAKGNADNGGGLSGLMMGLKDQLTGPAQLLYNALPASAQKAGDALDQWLYQRTGGRFGASGGFNNAVSQENAQYEADRAAAGRSGFDATRAAGNVIGGVPIALATGGTSAPATLTGAAARGALAGAVNGAASPVTDNSKPYWEQKVDQTALGAGFGAGGSVAARGVAALASPMVDAAQKKLIEAGVNLTPGQIIGGGVKRVEDALTSVPILGDAIKAAQRRSFESMNTGALNDALSTLKTKVPQGVTGREAVQFADDKISGAYQAVLSKIGAVKPDAQMANDMAQLAGMVANVPNRGPQLAGILQQQVADRIDSNGVMTAEGFKAADSNLREIAQRYLRANDADQNTLGAALMQARDNLRQMLTRTAPAQYVNELNNANAAFAKFLRVERAATSNATAGGAFTPEALSAAIKATDQSKRKGDYATGNALMQDFSDAAYSVMGNKVPDSGTPYRGMVAAGAALAGHGAPVVGPYVVPAVAGVAAGSLPYTQTGQKLAQALLAGDRPKALQPTFDALAEYLRNYSPAASGALAPALIQARK